jgi:hypothetical protein
MLLTSWTCEVFTELLQNIAEGKVIFKCSLHLCSWLNTSMYVCNSSFPCSAAIGVFLMTYMARKFVSSLALLLRIDTVARTGLRLALTLRAVIAVGIGWRTEMGNKDYGQTRN